MDSVLLLENLSVGFSERRNAQVLIQPFSLKVEASSFVALVGANGAGKSTLLRSIAGLQKPLDGDVFFYKGGQCVSFFSLPLKDRASVVSCSFTMRGELPQLSVRDYVSLGRYRFGGLGDFDENLTENVDRVLSELNLNEKAGKCVCNLSDGEFQRVEIARALAQETPVLLLDEPTSHLDYHSRREMMALLRDISRKRKLSIIVSTHELDLAEEYCDSFWEVETSGHLKVKETLNHEEVSMEV
jgi:iron complex transport system ATP-binding protein